MRWPRPLDNNREAEASAQYLIIATSDEIRFLRLEIEFCGQDVRFLIAGIFFILVQPSRQLLGMDLLLLVYTRSYTVMLKLLLAWIFLAPVCAFYTHAFLASRRIIGALRLLVTAGTAAATCAG
ncbi:uncharacterized protein PHALS_05554 [Plasmopara halstedii]|uniref:Uncharacterized protein n=1 Tax=Plasmopara halstedii TaxID=4781 RepID=A0A0P1B1L5_PLAHL|nr:uncharacterized protein PHALS_05554 [Plasmopara halstedii]CEG48078.1 hypothetical protein PHALS_05554 [Plasmopara halstedii]|eukprot:XP_024584447.1 hypothetical protein PHALS_05554 [Plasmopara halstedii]